MKRLAGIILVVAFAIFAIADTIHDFIANDTIHYFSEQPHRLLLVAVIGIVGGLVAFGFSTLSPRLQRRAKLAGLGSGASFVTLAAGCFSFEVAALPPEIRSAVPHDMLFLLLPCAIAIAGLLWLEFYRILRRRDCVAYKSMERTADGAAVLPFSGLRLPPSCREHVSSAVLIVTVRRHGEVTGK